MPNNCIAQIPITPFPNVPHLCEDICAWGGGACAQTSEHTSPHQVKVAATMPIAYDENKAAASQKCLSDYNTSATAPMSDDTQPNPHNNENVNNVKMVQQKLIPIVSFPRIIMRIVG